MECDKNVGLINQKTLAETPEDWRNAIASARVKPSPFLVVDCNKEMFYAWGKALATNYQTQFNVETRPIKQIIFRSENTQTVQHRNTYNGAFTSTVVVNGPKKNTNQRPCHLQEVQLEKAYSGPVPLSMEKFKDLQSLKRYCRQEAQDFLNSLPHQPVISSLAAMRVGLQPVNDLAGKHERNISIFILSILNFTKILNKLFFYFLFQLQLIFP